MYGDNVAMGGAIKANDAVIGPPGDPPRLQPGWAYVIRVGEEYVHVDLFGDASCLEPTPLKRLCGIPRTFRADVQRFDVGDRIPGIDCGFHPRNSWVQS